MRDREQSRTGDQPTNAKMLQIYESVRSQEDLSNDEMAGALIGFDLRGLVDGCNDPSTVDFSMIVLTRSIKILTAAAIHFDFQPTLIEERGLTSILKFRRMKREA